jgi:hypothetical protein
MEHYGDYMITALTDGEYDKTKAPETDHQQANKGYGLIFHPDFIKGYPLAKAIKNYGFFSYAGHVPPPT